MILTAQNDLLIKFQRGRSQIIHDRVAPHIREDSKNVLNTVNIF